MATELTRSIDGYDLREQLSQGSMSDVFVAIRRRDSQKVVFKIASSQSDPRVRQRLIREHELLRDVHHPNLVKLLDHGISDERPYLVLEYVDGATLRQRLISGKPLPWHQIAWIVEQISSAVATLHAAGILHRDIKPENVLIDRHQRVKLIDLSIGADIASLGELTCQGEFLGTVDYMAPEQRHRLQLDERADQYSLAAMAFEMLTGQCSLGQFRSPSDLNSQLPKTVDKVILKALERDASDRYQSIDQFTEAFLEAGRNRRPIRSTFAFVACAVMLPLLVSINTWFRREEPQTLTTGVESSADEPRVVTATAPDERLPTLTNSLGMELIQIPAGQFEMGADKNEVLAKYPRPAPSHVRDVEWPRHTVRISGPLWMGKYEVTVAEFREFISDSRYLTTGELWVAEYGCGPMDVLWNAPARYPVADDLPVCGVSWDDASEFCRWLSNREGTTYRLPTEAEWEYACRAGTTGLWSCDEGELPAFAVYNREWNIGPLPIGQRQANRWGFHDMHGNVHEWCQDFFTRDFYARSPIEDPVCDSPTNDDVRRVLRSGGYRAAPPSLRCSMRRGHEPNLSHVDLGHAIGFRVVAESLQPRLAARGPR